MKKPSLVHYLKNNLDKHNTTDFKKYDTAALNETGENALLLVIAYNDSFDLKVTAAQLTYLIDNSDLMHTDHYGENAFIKLSKYFFEVEKIIESEQISVIVNTTLNNMRQCEEWQKTAFRTLNSLKKESTFPIIWRHIKDKDCFIEQTLYFNQLYTNDFQWLLDMPEVVSYREKMHLNLFTPHSDTKKGFKL